MIGVIDSSLIDSSVFSTSVSAFLPDTAYVAFSQDGMKPLEACVSPGDTVSEGEVIARSKDKTIAAIHAPIPGRVECFAVCHTPNGKKTPAAKIRLSGVFSYLGKPLTISPWNSEKRKKLINMLAEKGIVNTFTRPRSLRREIAELPKKKGCIIAVRLFDNDPSQNTDSFIAAHHASEIMEGAALLAYAVDAAGIVFLYDEEKLPSWRETYASFDYHTAVCFVRITAKKYPSGTTSAITEAVREYSAASKKDSNDAVFAAISYQDIFVDSATLLNVYRALVLGIPVLETYIHISGSVIKTPGIFSVRIGTLIQNIIDECGGFIKQPGLVIINGKAAGISINKIAVPVTKYVKSIRFLQKHEIPDQKQCQCIRCGQCRRICPHSLEPDVLFAHASGLKAASDETVLSSILCSDCALCNASCPSRLPLCQFSSFLKESFVTR
jgi:electron transport complex protein RnfC